MRMSPAMNPMQAPNTGVGRQPTGNGQTDPLRAPALFGSGIRARVDRPWHEYPVGTKAPAIMGGHWYRTATGWKWNGPFGSGGDFPTPGGDNDGTVVLPQYGADSSPDPLKELCALVSASGLRMVFWVCPNCPSGRVTWDHAEGRSIPRCEQCGRQGEAR